MFPFRIVVCGVLCIGLSLLGADSLRFGAFSLEAGISGLIERYPRSSHEFRPADGGAAVFPEKMAELRDLIAHGTGQYAIRILPEEATQDVFGLEAVVERGVVKSIHLSLEQPDSGNVKLTRDPLSSLERRHPACSPVLADLTRRYGRPEGPRNSSEERLENRRYVWKNDVEELALVCGHYLGRTRVFAMDVILTRVGN